MTDETQQPEQLTDVVETAGVDESTELEHGAALPDSPDQPPGESDPAEPDTEGEEEQEEQEEQEEPASSGKKGGFQRKLEKLAEENQRLTQQLQALTGGQSATAEAAPKPTADDYDDYDTYYDALAAWHVKEQARVQAAELREHLVRQEQEAQLASFKAASKAFHESTPDYLDVLKTVDDIQLPPAVQQMLLAVDNGPALMYELARNRSQLESLAAMKPMAAALQIGALSANLKQTKVPPVSKAPAPIKPLGTSTPSAGKSPEDMTMAEYRAWRAVNS